MPAFLSRWSLERWQRGRRVARILADVYRYITIGERAQASRPSDHEQASAQAQKALERLAVARQEAGSDVGPEMDLLEARALFLAGRAAEALPAAHRAATARPYDVDSRVTHGLICLALDRIDEAEHEFESVLEEFGGDPDAERGRRAVRLAQGQAPIDEHALPDDLHDAAVVLVRCWRAAGAVSARFAGLEARVDEGDAEPEVVAAIASVVAESPPTVGPTGDDS